MKMTNQELDFDITQYHKCGGELYWYGCYEGDGYYKQYFEPSTYAHPAKISHLLTERIFKHLEQLGLLKEGMTVLDFMAGSFRVPLLASLRGYKSIGVELEPHFTKMGNDNKKFAENKIGRKLDMTTIQGDSRQLSKLLKSSDVGIISPPFTDMNHPTNYLGKQKKESCSEYSNNPENIGNLPYKDMVAVVSPPFLNADKSGEKHGLIGHNKNCNCNFCKKNKTNAGYVQGYRKEHQSNNPSNIGNLKYKEMVGIVSPPYQDAIINFEDDEGKKRAERLRQAGFDRKNSGMIRSIETKSDINAYKGFSKGYSQNPQNIGNLKDKGFVGITSPPYAHDSIISVTNKSDLVKEKFNNIPYSNETIDYESRRNLITGRFDSANFENIGRLKDSEKPEGQENYLSAMLQVYKEASKVCPVICTITKNPTRNGKLRRLDLDTAKLLELSGYKIIDYHRAVLFKTFEQQTLTGKTKKEYKGRLSFFKRLSLQKGNTASEWEDIIIGIKN